MCNTHTHNTLNKKMHRLGWWQTSVAIFPPAVSKYISNEDGVIAPTCLPIDSYEVIISSCAGSGQLHHIGWKLGSFTHVIIDESCQALEPEVIMNTKVFIYFFFPSVSLLFCFLTISITFPFPSHPLPSHIHIFTCILIHNIMHIYNNR
jgi:hypothetical protein